MKPVEEKGTSVKEPMQILGGDLFPKSGMLSSLFK
jgi:hypothetical protein